MCTPSSLLQGLSKRFDDASPAMLDNNIDERNPFVA
jgi:hypothetical protein